MFLKFQKTASESDFRSSKISLFGVVVLEGTTKNVTKCQTHVQKHSFRSIILCRSRCRFRCERLNCDFERGILIFWRHFLWQSFGTSRKCKFYGGRANAKSAAKKKRFLLIELKNGLDRLLNTLFPFEK